MFAWHIVYGEYLQCRLAPGSNLGWVCIFFLIYLGGSVTDFWHLFEQPKYMFVSQEKLGK